MDDPAALFKDIEIDKVANDLDMLNSINSPSFRVAEITVGGKKA